MSTYVVLLKPVLQALETSLRMTGPSQLDNYNHSHNAWRNAWVFFTYEVFMLSSAPASTSLSLPIEKMSQAVCKLLEELVADSITPCTRREQQEAGPIYPRLYAVRELWIRRGRDCGGPEVRPWNDRLESLIRRDIQITELKTITIQLESHNRALVQLVHDIPLSGRAEKPPSIAKSIRKLYAGLHDAVQRDWRCSCTSCHILHLRLNANTFDDEQESLDVDFFFYRGPGPHRWQEGRISIEEPIILHASSSNGKRACFEDVHTSKDDPSSTRVSSVCRYVSTQKHADLCLRLQLRNDAFREVSSVPRTHRDLLFRPAISLDELLRLRGRFTAAGKRILAVILAKSILPLLNTPWLSNIWTKENIYFAYQRGGRLSEPFISTNPKLGHASDYEKSSIGHQHPGLLSLGILLWEIELGQPIEDLCEDEDLAEVHDSPNTRYGTALRLLQSRREDLCPGYMEALDTCLNAELPPMSPMNGANWQEPDETDWRTMYNKIVSPLENELKAGCSHVLAQTWSEAVKTLSDIWRASDLRCWSPPVLPQSYEQSSGVNTTQRSLATPATTVLTKQHDKLPHLDAGMHTSYPVAQSQLSLSLSQQPFDDEFTDPGKARDTRRWLQHMQRDFEARLDSTPGIFRVKIAVLDTGFDPSDNFIRGSSTRIAAHHCLQDSQRADQDTNGHGTHILALLLKYAPSADLYVLRISHAQISDGVDYVARAIEWAVDEWHVDIISMSFGFPSRNGRLSDAITKASSKNAIIFAAASNGGGNDGRTYPASDGRVICIHSTDGNGNRSIFSPTAKRNCDNFALPGESIESSWPRTSDSTMGTKMKSGTSFATPVAVALAANILEYAEQKLNAMPRDLRNFLKSSDGMRTIFRLMVEERDHPRDDYDYLTPWKLFGQERSDDYIYHMMKTALE